MHLLRIAAGLVIAPFAGLALFVIVAGALNPNGDNYGFAFALMIAYLITLVLGVPALFAFHLLELSRWWHYCVGGAVIGVVGILLVTFQPHDWPRINNESSQLIACALLGAVSALVFWFVAIFQPAHRHAA
jgi:hypothetical protein